jgi:hypothetical protein
MVFRPTRGKQRIGRHITPWRNLAGKCELERRVGSQRPFG